MTKKPPRNMAASVHQRLKNVARETDRPFNEVLQYFAMERFLYRLSASKYADTFVLKGALLFRVWNTHDSRATLDIDFLAYMDNNPGNLESVIRDIISNDCPDDGVIFDSDSVEARQIKEGADYEGVRVRFLGYLGNARITMQVDIGFGDPIYPTPKLVGYPTTLDLPAPSLRSYPPETVIAEKVEAMVHLGRLNSRMKDFFDVWRIAQLFNFDSKTLCESIRRTFATRGTEIIPFDELQAEVVGNLNIENQWRAFVLKSKVEAPASFADILGQIGMFLEPLLSAAKDGHTMVYRWSAPGPWRK